MIIVAGGGEGDLVADQPARHRVAGRPEPDTRQPVDLPADRPSAHSSRNDGSGPSSGCSTASRSAGTAQISAWVSRVDLSAPHGGRAVGRSMIIEGLLRDHQVSLGIADQMLHHPLRLRIRRLTEVGPKPVVGGEADIIRGRHHHVGDHPRFQAAHPVRQHQSSAPRRGSRSIRPAVRTWWRPSRRRRTGRIGTATRPAPRRTHAVRPRHPSR